MEKIVVAGKYQLEGLSEPGEFQFGGDGIVYNHERLSEDEAAALVEKGYPHLKLIEEPAQKTEEQTDQSTGAIKKKQPQQ